MPTGSRQAALAALALYPACRPRALLAQRAARGVVALLGPRALPGRAAQWTPPLDAGSWASLREAITEAAGAWNACAFLERPQPGRSGFALLALHDGRPVAFAKIRPEAGALLAEARALELVGRGGPRGFVAPTVLWSGAAGGWHALVMDVVLPGPHAPAMDIDPRAIADDVTAALEGFPRPPATPDGWRPMHGDLTPWNLRRRGDGRLALVDWESAGWGPPGADAVLYRASRSAIRGEASPPVECDWVEAVEHWRGEVRGRGEGTRDARLAAALESVLGGMSPAREVRA